MARKRKGDPVHGWMVVDKPAGITSAAVVNKARWALSAQKAGHSGTLDPDATGCLAIAFGEAAKTVSVAQDGMKTYRFAVRWGRETTTDDAAGEVVAASDERPAPDAIRAALPRFNGRIMQVPPQVSAVKVGGVRAHDLARGGVAVALAPRPLWVERLALLDTPDPDRAEFELVCGKGGYVRAIARDLGRALGCFGHVCRLRRLSTGPFDLSGAVPFAALDARCGADERPALTPLEAGLAGLPGLAVSAAEAEDLRHGRAVPVAGPDRDLAWAGVDGKAVALGGVRAGVFQPTRVILPH